MRVAPRFLAVAAAVWALVPASMCRSDEWPPEPGPAGSVTFAASKGDLAVVKHMISTNPASLNTREGPNGLTPLIAAVTNRKTACALWLLERGADVNAKDTNYEMSALDHAMPAYEDDRPDMGLIAAMVKHGADLNARHGTPERTALYRAADIPGSPKKRPGAEVGAYRLRLIRPLVSLGADPNVRDKAGKTIIERARGEYRADLNVTWPTIRTTPEIVSFLQSRPSEAGAVRDAGAAARPDGRQTPAGIGGNWVADPITLTAGSAGDALKQSLAALTLRIDTDGGATLGTSNGQVGGHWRRDGAGILISLRGASELPPELRAEPVEDGQYLRLSWKDALAPDGRAMVDLKHGATTPGTAVAGAGTASAPVVQSGPGTFVGSWVAVPSTLVAASGDASFRQILNVLPLRIDDGGLATLGVVSGTVGGYWKQDGAGLSISLPGAPSLFPGLRAELAKDGQILRLSWADKRAPNGRARLDLKPDPRGAAATDPNAMGNKQQADGAKCLVMDVAGLRIQTGGPIRSAPYQMSAGERSTYRSVQAFESAYFKANLRVWAFRLKGGRSADVGGEMLALLRRLRGLPGNPVVNVSRGNGAAGKDYDEVGGADTARYAGDSFAIAGRPYWAERLVIVAGERVWGVLAWTPKTGQTPRKGDPFTMEEASFMDAIIYAKVTGAGTGSSARYGEGAE